VAVPPGGRLVEAPLSACVWKVLAAPGDRVAAGDPLLVLEAMKMEVVVRAPADGTVARVLAEPGRQIDAGTPLAVLARAEDAAVTGEEAA
jgi:urea carboxylase